MQSRVLVRCHPGICEHHSDYHSYTCGAKWQTCACSEEDQLRRWNELAARRVIIQSDNAAREQGAIREAERQREEEELRAALEAIAESERQERELQEEEEGRRAQEQIARAENDRVKMENARRAEELRNYERMTKIGLHHTELQLILDELHRLQRKKIFERHRIAMSAVQRQLEDLASKESALEVQMNQLQTHKEQVLEATRKTHAREIMQTVCRHRSDQDKYLAKMADAGGGEPLDELITARMIEELTELQEIERMALRSKHTRELRRFDKQPDEVSTARISDQLEFLQGEKGLSFEAGDKLERLMNSDWRWFNLVCIIQMALLEEDKYHLISSEADAPL